MMKEAQENDSGLLSFYVDRSGSETFSGKKTEKWRGIRWKRKTKKENKKDTKLCKHCKTEIPKDAKVCPNCRKKQKGIGKWIAIAVVVVILIAAMSGGENKPKKVETADAESSETTTESATDTSEDREEKDTFGIGETAEMNDVQVTMVSYSENEGSEYNKPTDGNEYVMVEFEIVNNSETK